MNATERTELAQLLPAPGEPQLLADRHRLLKDAFLQQITEPAKVRTSWRLNVVTPLTAAALVALVALAVIFLPQQHRQPVDPASITPSQFIYVKTIESGLEFSDKNNTVGQMAGEDPRVLGPLRVWEYWMPQQGSQALIRRDGQSSPIGVMVSNGIYASLPTEPAALLKRIYAETKGPGQTPQYRAFDWVGAVLETSMLPESVNLALYQAATLIPGAIEVPDTQDASGRHGVAVAFDYLGERRQWIFDPTTYQYLGKRSYLVSNTIDGPAGTPTGASAVLRRDVVDKAGELPR